MKKWILAFACAVVFAAASTCQAQAPPPNCSTATGSPCQKITWTAVSCSATVTNGGTNGAQDSGPCVIGVLRCTGTSTVCTTASLPVQSSTVGAALIGNSTWKVLTGTLAETTSNGTYFDNAGLSYSTTYTDVLTAEYSGAGGGVWGAYSSTFQVAFGQAPQAPAGVPATPSGGAAVTQ
jgi:hypothetical protein